MTHCDELFEEIIIDCRKSGNMSVFTNSSEVTKDTLIKEKDKPSECQAESNFYMTFMETNREFFEKIGYTDISNDPLFSISTEVAMRKDLDPNICGTCNDHCSRIFTSYKFCKFCGIPLCDNCASRKRKMQFKNTCTQASLICVICDNKFKMNELQLNFKEKINQNEAEISQMTAQYEKYSMIYSDQLDEINRLTNELAKITSEHERKLDMLSLEYKNLSSKKEDVCKMSENATMKITQSIQFLKALEKKKNIKENEVRAIQKDCDELFVELENRECVLNLLNAKIKNISTILNKLEQDELNERATKTGNSQLDQLLKSKITAQRASIRSKSNATGTDTDTEIIIINPSKEMSEIYLEPLNSEGRLKRWIMYIGSKLFD